MHAQNPLVNDGGDWQHVETAAEFLPQRDGIPPLALVVKAIHSIDVGAFVISTQEEDMVRVFHLVGHQQAEGFDALLAAVHVVAHVKVFAVRRSSAHNIVHSKQVVVLPVKVSRDVDRRFEFEQGRLVVELLFGFTDQPLYILFGQFYVRALWKVPCLVQFVNQHVKEKFLFVYSARSIPKRENRLARFFLTNFDFVFHGDVRPHNEVEVAELSDSHG